MCRPEKPLTTSNKALRALQEWLREMRERAGLGYRALSVRAGCHATTLQRAASGEIVPKLQTVLSYARACDASPEEARLLWKQARYEETRLARAGRSRPAPRPQFIRDVVDLGAALVELYEKAGSPPLRIMEQRAGGYGALPRSSAHRIVNKRAMPHGLRQFQAYLRACEVPEVEWSDWEAAWTRAWRHEKQDDFVAISGHHDLADQEMINAWNKVGVYTRRLLRDRPGYFQDRASDVRVVFTDGNGQRLGQPDRTKAYETPRRASDLRIVLTDGSGKCLDHLAQTKAPETPRRVRPIVGRLHRHTSEQPVPQLALPFGDPEPEPGALF
ncbi:helix-turn-helix domain-containing protein [Streptomyces hawaiiensis]|uniref:helix-turn-helix domain-containing protein n=1 Tax=Streptomyces hawaiiensis TaxID=67305 RepID=UPI00365A1627